MTHTRKDNNEILLTSKCDISSSSTF